MEIKEPTTGKVLTAQHMIAALLYSTWNKVDCDEAISGLAESICIVELDNMTYDDKKIAACAEKAEKIFRAI